MGVPILGDLLYQVVSAARRAASQPLPKKSGTLENLDRLKDSVLDNKALQTKLAENEGLKGLLEQDREIIQTAPQASELSSDAVHEALADGTTGGTVDTEII